MPVSCCAVDCTNRFTKGSGVGFFIFPVNPERKKKNGFMPFLVISGSRKAMINFVVSIS